MLGPIAGRGRWQFGCLASRKKHGSRLCLLIPYMRFAPRVEFKKSGRVTTIRTMTSAPSMTARTHSVLPTSLICISGCGPSPEPRHGLNTNSNRQPRCLLPRFTGSTTGDSVACPHPGASCIRTGTPGSQSRTSSPTVAMRLEVEPATKLYKAGQIGPPAAMFIDKDTQWREFGLLEWRIS